MRQSRGLRIGITSRVRIAIIDSLGNTRIIETKNFLTEAGEAYLADRLSDRDETDGDIDYMAVGSGSGQNRQSTTLATEVARVALDGGYPDQLTGGDDNDIIWQATFPANTPATDETLSEGGLFSKSTAGVLINYFEIVPNVFKPTSTAIVVQCFWTIGVS